MASLTATHRSCLSSSVSALLPRLAIREWSDETYLAGSAALALYLAHRPVTGLDLMSATNRLRGPDRRDLLQDLVALDAGARIETARDGYLFARLGCGTALRLYYYPYPLIKPAAEIDGLAVASPIDLGLMKIAAIISRGTRRDFVDLHFLCRRLHLAELLDRSTQKFGHVIDFRLQALKALADHSLLDGEPMPDLTDPLEWTTVETWLHTEIRRLGRQHVGLD